MLTSFDGGRLFGEVHGSGTPQVLALHGWRRDHRDFSALLGGTDPLPAVALDLPGFGATPPPPEAWGSLEYARALAPVLDEMAAEVVVAGHSFGGRLAVQLAAAHPEQVRGVLLTGAPLFAAQPANRRPRPRWRYRAVRALARSGLVGERWLEAMKLRYGSADYRAASGVMRDVLVRAVSEEWDDTYLTPLRAISCPVELVWGALDSAVPPSVADRIAKELSGPVSLLVVPGVGHLTPEAVPAQLRAGIDRLLVTTS